MGLGSIWTLGWTWSPLEAPVKPPWSPLQASSKLLSALKASSPLEAPFKPPWSPLEASSKLPSALKASSPFKPPWSPLEAPFKPLWSPLKVKPPWSPLAPSSPLQASSKPPSSPLQVSSSPLEAFRRWRPLQAFVKGTFKGCFAEGEAPFVTEGYPFWRSLEPSWESWGPGGRSEIYLQGGWIIGKSTTDNMFFWWLSRSIAIRGHFIASWKWVPGKHRRAEWHQLKTPTKRVFFGTLGVLPRLP